MAKKEARHTADVVHVYVPDLAAIPPVLVTTWQDLIARYQEKFMPAAAGVYSRAEYNIAKQILSEDVGGWHARLCLYNQAYLGQEVDNNLPLIEKFVTQLINKEVGKFVFVRDPGTFAGALALAQTKTATDVTFKSASHGASIHALANQSEKASTIRVEDAVADEEGAKRAAAALKGETEKQASAGSVTPSLTNAPSARCGLRQWRLPGRKRAVAPPPTDEQEAEAVAQAVAEQTTAAALLASVAPFCPLLPLPPLSRAEKIPHRCLKAKTIGRSRKTRQARFGPAGRGASYYR
jgi:hypothetical protein